VGAILYANQRNVTWFLMRTRHIPTECDMDSNCIIARTTQDGFVVFETDDVESNTRHFICAQSNVTHLYREGFIETLEAISSCSNGFVIDTTAPDPGLLHVQNYNGFLTATKDVLVYWNTFTDNIKASSFGYPSDIKEYVLMCGKVVFLVLLFKRCHEKISGLMSV